MNGTLTATETWTEAEGTEGFVVAPTNTGDTQRRIQQAATNSTQFQNNALSSNTLSYPYYYYYGSYPVRIRLTLSEVNKLRAAAKKDRAIKDILKKFTNHIDLVVDFE